MKISEIFYSIQGEGTLVGMPSVFVRTSGCNLRCKWCDTPYTSWRPEGDGKTVEQIVSEVRAFGAHHVVVTGGEPMIAPEIVRLTELLAAEGLHITVETAGTVAPPVTCHLMSISPKLSNSIPYQREEGKWAAQHDRLRIQYDVLRTLTERYPYQLKFVVNEPGDLGEIEQICAELGAPAQSVLLMPEGTTRAMVLERSLWIAELCKQHGFRFSPRLHVDLWGDRRGV